MLTNIQHSFTDRLTSKYETKSSLTILPHLTGVATLSCEISLFKNFHAQDLSEARLSHSKELLKIMYSNSSVI